MLTRKTEENTSWERPRTKEEKRAEALEILDITEADILAIPKVEPLLEQAQILDKVWDYLQLGREFNAAKLLLVKYDWLKVSKLEKFVPFEAYCASAKVQTLEVLAVLSKVMKSHVDLLNNSKKLGTLHDSTGSSSSRDVAVLPAIEDDIRTMSDRFNERLITRPPAPPADEEEEEEDEQ